MTLEQLTDNRVQRRVLAAARDLEGVRHQLRVALPVKPERLDEFAELALVAGIGHEGQRPRRRPGCLALFEPSADNADRELAHAVRVSRALDHGGSGGLVAILGLFVQVDRVGEHRLDMQAPGQCCGGVPGLVLD